MAVSRPPTCLGDHKRRTRRRRTGRKRRERRGRRTTMTNDLPPMLSPQQHHRQKNLGEKKAGTCRSGRMSRQPHDRHSRKFSSGSMVSLSVLVLVTMLFSATRFIPSVSASSSSSSSSSGPLPVSPVVGILSGPSYRHNETLNIVAASCRSAGRPACTLC